jgi:phosphoglycerol transferase MdoB-like AlkP superfamily enzyme
MWGAIEPHWNEANDAIDFESIDFPSKLDRDEYLCAIAQAMETDAFIGDFMEQLRADGKAENTAVVFLTDHYAKYMTDTEFVMSLKGAPNRDLLTRVPFVIWSEHLKPQVIDKAVSILDIMPTIASLFNLDVDLRYYLGNDMFASGAGLVNFVDGHWYDGTTYYDGGTYYTVTKPDAKEKGSDTAQGALTLSPMHSVPDAIREQTSDAANRIHTAWRTFQSDYFAYLTQKKKT